MSALRAAERYVRAGFAVVPIPYRTKRPVLDGWEALRLSADELPEHFNGQPQNIGLLLGDPSGGLVDVDLDVAEAVSIAGRFLTPTLTSGRENRPHSHWWYVSPGTGSCDWKDTDSKKLAELRSTGRQTLVAPSVHPDGDRYVWAASGLEIARVTPQELTRQVRELATATLIAHHVPPVGGRHDYAMALAGFLLRGRRLEENTVLKIMLAAWHAAGADSREAKRDLEGIVRDTAENLVAGERVVGGPTLEESAPGVVRQLYKWWGWERKNQRETVGKPGGQTSFVSFVPEPPPWPTLPDEVLYGLAGDIVRRIEPHTEADPVAVLANLLAAFGNAIGRGAFLRVGADVHYLKLNIGLVGETSKGRKGMSWAHARDLMHAADSEWADERVLHGLSSGEGLIYAVRDRVTGRNKKGEEIILDEGVDDKRLLVFEAELAGVLKVMSREGNTLSPVIRQAWDGDRLQVMTRNNPMKATGAHVSIVGHITKGELLRHLTETEAANGFANRFTWLLVKRSKELPFGGEWHKVDAAPLVKQLRSALEFGSKPKEIRWGEQAKAIWREVYGPLSAGKPGLFGAVVGRAEAQVVRLAALYAVLDESCEIKREHLLAAIALWDYAERSARYIFGDATGDPVADQVLEALRAAGEEGMTRTEISNLFGRNKSAERISRALSALLNPGLVRRTREETDGRAAERWHAL